MKKHTCCAILSSTYSLDEQICSLSKEDSRTAESFVTGEKNSMSKGSYWTVNFFTGHKFGRFYPEQEMAVRLVRDR